MGYLAKLDGAIQCQEKLPAPISQEPKSQPFPVQPVAATPVSAIPAASQPPVTAAPVAAQVHKEVETPAAPAIQLDAPAPADDAAARTAHEEAEAKRKADWESKQVEKKAARQKQLDRIKAMNDAELLAASVKRVAADTERLTRRNMKEAVAEHIQAKCREDTTFAMLVMDPEKSIVNCFRYINRKAQEYAEQEMKDNGIERTGVYGLDVPDGLVYQWAVDYFNAPDVQEDQEKEEKFVPRPYVGKSSASKSAAKPKAKKEPVPKAAPKPQVDANVDGQLSFMGVAG